MGALVLQSTARKPEAKSYQMGSGVGRDRMGELKWLRHFLPQTKLGLELEHNEVLALDRPTCGRENGELEWGSGCTERLFTLTLCKAGSFSG